MIRRLAGEAAWIIAGQAATVIGTLALVRVLTEYLNPALYGELALALTVVSFGQTVIFGGWTYTVTRFYAQSRKTGNLSGYLDHCLRIVTRLACIWVLALSVLAMGLWQAGYGAHVPVLLLILPFSITNGFLSTLNSIQNARRDRRNAAMSQAGDTWLRIGLVIAAIQLFGATVVPVLLAYCVSSLGISLVIWLRLRRAETAHVPVSPVLATQMRSYSWPFYIWGPFLWAQQSADRWALGSFANAYEIGIYAAVMQLSFGPTRIAISTFMRLVAPIMFGKLVDLDDPACRNAAFRFVTRIAAVTLAGTVIASSIVWFSRDAIFLALVGSAYAEGADYLPWMLLASGLFGTGQVLSLRLMGGDSTRHLILPNLAPAVIGIALSVIGAWKGGIWGVVLSQITFGLLQLSWLMIKARRMDRDIAAIAGIGTGGRGFC